MFHFLPNVWNLLLFVIFSELTSVLLLVFRQHLCDCDEGFYLHHVLFADVIQFLKMALTDVVNSGQVPGERQHELGSKERRICTWQDLLSRDLHQGKVFLAHSTGGRGTPPFFPCSWGWTGSQPVFYMSFLSFHAHCRERVITWKIFLIISSLNSNF